MPSYAPSKPRLKPLVRRGPRPLALDWTIRTFNALAAIEAITTADPRTIEHVANAHAQLALLRSAKTNRAHAKAHKAAARELAIAFYLIEPKDSEG